MVWVREGHSKHQGSTRGGVERVTVSIRAPLGGHGLASMIDSWKELPGEEDTGSERSTGLPGHVKECEVRDSLGLRLKPCDQWPSTGSQ